MIEKRVEKLEKEITELKITIEKLIKILDKCSNGILKNAMICSSIIKVIDK